MKFVHTLITGCLLVIGTTLADDNGIRSQGGVATRTIKKRSIRPNGEPEQVKDENGVVTKRRSRLDMRDLILAGHEKETVEIQLMSDEEIETFNNMTRDDDDDDPFESWSDMNLETGRSLTVVKSISKQGVSVTAGTLYGKNGTIYQIRQLADKDVIVEQVPQSSFDKEFEAEFLSTSGLESDVDFRDIDEVDVATDQTEARRLQNDSPSVIDVMVLYTRGAMCAAAGYGSGGGCSPSANNVATMEGLINLAISETNRAYQNSGIPTKLRLVKTHYDGTFNDYTNTWERALPLLRNPNDGQIDYVHAMRNDVGADFVSMIVDMNSYCGIGYRPDNPTADNAFSLVKWSCATGYYSFGHEMAHNMGCNHDRANSGGAGSGYNYGYQDGRFRSIMAYDCPSSCPRVQYFSNPSVTYSGARLGDSTTNNAQWIRDRLSTYANFRPSKASIGFNQPPPPPPPPPPPATKSPTPAPRITGPPTNDDSLETDFTGGLIGAAGNMFDIRAKTDLSVTNFAVHSTAATLASVEVWIKKTTGTFVGAHRDQSQWQFLGRATFSTGAAGEPSVMPRNSFPPVFIKRGDTQAFYVTFDGSMNYNRYSRGTTLGGVQSSNTDMDILQGYAKGFRFGLDYFPRNWNGIVYYDKTAAPPPTPPPTRQPTPSPTRPPTPPPTSPLTPPPTPKPVSSPTLARNPSPTDLVLQQLETTFAGGNGQAGNMIELQASSDIVVTAFDMHTFSTRRVHAYVYYKKGTYMGFERSAGAWTKICDTFVDGQGSPNPTRIPESSVTPVSISAGEVYSFYITLDENTVRYTNGKVSAQDGIVTIRNSNGNRYPFSSTFRNRIWNGVLYYKISSSDVQAPVTSVGSSGPYGPSKEIQTTFANRNGSFGNMFDIEAKEKLIVHNVWIHTYHLTNVEVEVYKLSQQGQSYLGNEKSPGKWEKIGGAIVQGQGTGKATKLPAGSIDEVLVEKGMKQAFYVTIIGGGIRYSGGNFSPGLQVFTENSDMKIFEGSGVGAPLFGGTFTPRVFNGVLEYYTPDKAATDALNFDVKGEFEGLGGLKDEGWTCESGDECKSGMCGKASTESTDAGGIRAGRGRVGNRGSGRNLGEEFSFCLDHDGQHIEDGDAKIGLSRL